MSNVEKLPDLRSFTMHCSVCDLTIQRLHSIQDLVACHGALRQSIRAHMEAQLHAAGCKHGHLAFLIEKPHSL